MISPPLGGEVVDAMSGHPSYLAGSCASGPVRLVVCVGRSSDRGAPWWSATA